MLRKPSVLELFYSHYFETTDKTHRAFWLIKCLFLHSVDVHDDMWYSLLWKMLILELIVFSKFGCEWIEVTHNRLHWFLNAALSCQIPREAEQQCTRTVPQRLLSSQRCTFACQHTCGSQWTRSCRASGLVEEDRSLGLCVRVSLVFHIFFRGVVYRENVPSTFFVCREVMKHVCQQLYAELQMELISK